jgi:metal-responsive CopG/Arc/MetJ family transcriptional regulator
MPKQGITKSRISITVDKAVLEEINEECKKRTMKVSSYIEKLLKIGIQNEK